MDGLYIKVGAFSGARSDDHAHYIAHWLEIMKGDKKAIFTAAAAANRAVEWLHELQPKQD